MTAVAGGFELDQLLAACADVAKRTQQQEAVEEPEQQQQQQSQQGLGAAQGEDSDDGDALYADLLPQPTGTTTMAQQDIPLCNATPSACSTPCCLLCRHRRWWRGRQRAGAAATGADPAGGAPLVPKLCLSPA